MKASLNTMHQLGGPELGDLSELVKLATNRLGGLESVVEYGKRFDGILVAKVVSCEKHPDSDHLHVCMVDDGGVANDVERDKDGLVQVVCGAPNARVGITVAWIPPGMTVPKSLDEAEPFVLGKREIRGVVSNGMLASPAELGLFDNHDGILEISESEVGPELMKPGTEFKKLYRLDDVLLDFENKMFTHRPDCFGQIGLARELTAIRGAKYASPEWYLAKPEINSQKSENGLQVSSKNEILDKVPRFMLQVVEDISVKDSSVWIKSYLTKVGIKSKNSVVDLSNYYMHLTAQPTHAFDYDKLAKVMEKQSVKDNLHDPSGPVELYPRMARKGETIALLNGKTLELTEDDMVISCGNTAVALAGLMGGSETEVDESTTNIVIECATFDMYAVRRSSMRHGIFTDAVTRYTKGQSPLQNDIVLAKLVADLVGQDVVAAGMVYDSFEIEDRRPKIVDIEITEDFINSRLGTSLSADEICQILNNVEVATSTSDPRASILVTPPFWRTDLELKEDIVEEVGRLYGFDRLELKLPTRSTKPAPKNELNDFKTILRNMLSAQGANEVLSYSFVHGNLLTNTGVTDLEKWAYHIRNAISPDLQYYRTSVITSLLPKVHPNIKSDMVRSDDNEFALFEIGKVHVKGHNDDEGLPQEFERLAFVFAADEKTTARKYSGSAYYQAKMYMDSLLGDGVTYGPLETNDYPICSMYQIGRSAMVYVKGELLGVIGEYRSMTKKALKLPDFCAGFELDLGLLMKHRMAKGYEPIGVFPKTSQDITLIVPADKSYAEVSGKISDAVVGLAADKGYKITLAPRNLYQKDDKSGINYTFRIWLSHPEKTLQTEEVNKLFDELADKAHEDLKAVRV